jgi:Pyruvate/2-oxoacid:ferredoxin oxidoreductase gamma subunit
MKFSILIAGVGGQGIITLGKIIAIGGKIAGYNIVGSENKGGAQRGGKASSLVKLYRQVEPDLISARIGSGQLQLLLSLDLFETGRYVELYSRDTVIVSNQNAVIPPLARRNETQNGIEPLKLQMALQEYFPQTYIQDFSSLAGSVVDSSINANLFILAFASCKGFLPIATDELAEATGFVLGTAGGRIFQAALQHLTKF